MSKHVVTCTWDDVPHLTPATKAELLRSIPPYQRDARSKGVPQLGSGAVWGFPESELKVKDFPIPKHWKRGYALDAGGGAKPTAVVWGAYDPVADCVYVYTTYKRQSPEPAVHIAAVKAKGAWMAGVGDAAALIVTQHDAEQLISVYKRGGLDLTLPDKSVETGVTEVWQRMSEGRFKVFESAHAWFEEWRLYRRDDKGRIVKVNDHLMDATRYLILSGLKRFKVAPSAEPAKPAVLGRRPMTGEKPRAGWMRS